MFLAVFLLLFLQPVQQSGAAQSLKVADLMKFDEWHDLLFSDEKARLDNISIAWKDQSRNIIYLIIYAGRRACVGEAKARGIRAKNYLVKRKVPAAKIIWRDGGFKDEVTTEVWLVPPGAAKPLVFPQFNLKSSEVTFENSCKIKYRGGSRSPKQMANSRL